MWCTACRSRRSHAATIRSLRAVVAARRRRPRRGDTRILVPPRALGAVPCPRFSFARILRMWTWSERTIAGSWVPQTRCASSADGTDMIRLLCEGTEEAILRRREMDRFAAHRHITSGLDRSQACQRCAGCLLRQEPGSVATDVVRPPRCELPSSSVENGFRTKSSAPSLKPSTASSGRFEAVQMMMGASQRSSHIGAEHQSVRIGQHQVHDDEVGSNFFLDCLGLGSGGGVPDGMALGCEPYHGASPPSSHRPR